MAHTTRQFRILILMSSCCLINWGGQEDSVEGKKKQSVNFYGTLTTHQNKQFTVENISIARLYKQIPVYEMQAASTAHAATATRPIANDPKTGIITYLDLSETAEISAPHPDIIWTYQKGDSMRKTEYIEITVTSRDAAHTKTSYLIDTRRKLVCDRINEAGPIEMEAPIESIKQLVITGYKQREEKKPSCVPCIAPHIAPEQSKPAPAAACAA